MKSKNSSQYVIPVLVIVCSLVLLAALTFALGGFQWKSSKGRTLEIEFRDVTGVKLHSPVRYAASLDIIQTITLAMSSPTPTRPSGIFGRNRRLRPSLSKSSLK